MATTTVEFRSQTGSGGVTSDGYVRNEYGNPTNCIPFDELSSTVQSMARVSTSSINAGIYLQADWTQTNKYYSAQATYFAFDTSSIPADATITGAKLKLYGYAGYKASLLGKADLVVVESLQLDNSTLATSDWTRRGSEVFGRIGYDSFSDSSFNDISLATSSIVVGGTTKLCAFLDWFIEGYDGGWSGGGYTQYVIYLADEAGTSKDPVLEVTYTTEDVSYEEENPVGEIVNEFGLPVILKGNAGKKQYYYKIYNQGSTLWDVNKWDTDNWDYSVDYMTTWTEDVLSIPSFTTDINGGAGAMYVRLKRDITEFGEGSDVDLFNKVDVYVSDRQSPNGQLIYRGYINSYAPVFENDQQYIEVELWGYISRLSQVMLKDGNATTVTYSSQDPANILKDVINKYRAIEDFGVHYTSDSIDLTGTTVSYTFTLNTIKEALDKIIELCPEDWCYYIGADGTVYLQQSDIYIPDHRFTRGRDILNMRINKNLDSVVNQVYFVGDGIFTLNETSGSIGTWGTRAIKKVDERVSLAGTASAMTDKILTESSSPKTLVDIEIVDTGRRSDGLGYDIETINVGDSLRIDNIDFTGSSISNWDTATWDWDVWDYSIQESQSQILTILKTRYTGDSMYLTAGLGVPVITKRVEDINRNLENSQTYDIADTPS